MRRGSRRRGGGSKQEVCDRNPKSLSLRNENCTMTVKKTKDAPKTGKKPSARKGKAEQKKDNPTDALAKELQALIPRLDAEGLEFLIEQAQVHLYNMQVDELNRTMERKAAAKAAMADTKVKTGKIQDVLRIEGSPSGSSFYIVCNGQSIMFSRDEIIHMVHIVCAPGTKLEIQEHLLDWFTRERRDVFSVIPIADKFDERLNKIAALLKKNYRIRTR